jgi:hypothetical protein
VKTPAGKLLICVYLLCATFLFGKIVTAIASIPLNRHGRRQDARILTQFGAHLTTDDLLAICKGGQSDDECTKAEFILRMLIWLDRIDVDEVEVIANKVRRGGPMHDPRFNC